MSVLLGATSVDRDWFVIASVILAGLYFIALVVFDRFLSTRSSWRLLCQYLEELADHLNSPPVADGAPVPEAQANVLRAAATASLADLDRRWYVPISTTRVLSIWRRAHDIECALWEFAPLARVVARLGAARAELAGLKRPDAMALAQQIACVLEPKPPAHVGDLSPRFGVARGRWSLQLTRTAGPSSPSVEDLRSLLQQGVRIIDDARDTRFESLADLQIKSTWLAIFGLALITLGELAQHRPQLFLFGAFGAFASVLTGLQRRIPSDADYGSSSGRLFVSPVSGAIAGWLGVLLVAALANPNIKLLGPVFRDVWSDPTSALALGVATAFGFSERLLDRMLRQAESAISSGTASNP